MWSGCFETYHRHTQSCSLGVLSLTLLNSTRICFQEQCHSGAGSGDGADMPSGERYLSKPVPAAHSSPGIRLVAGLEAGEGSAN